MKTLFTMIALGLSMGIYAQTVSADIRGRDCGGGRGLCSVFVQSSDVTLKSHSPVHQLTRQDKHTIVLTIDRADLSKEEEKQLTDKPLKRLKSDETYFYKMPYDLVLEKEVVQALHIEPPYRKIAKGKYPLKTDKKKAYITFTLEKE